MKFQPEGHPPMTLVLRHGRKVLGMEEYLGRVFLREDPHAKLPKPAKGRKTAAAEWGDGAREPEVVCTTSSGGCAPSLLSYCPLPLPTWVSAMLTTPLPATSGVTSAVTHVFAATAPVNATASPTVGAFEAVMESSCHEPGATCTATPRRSATFAQNRRVAAVTVPESPDTEKVR